MYNSGVPVYCWFCHFDGYFFDSSKTQQKTLRFIYGLFFEIYTPKRTKSHHFGSNFSNFRFSWGGNIPHQTPPLLAPPSKTPTSRHCIQSTYMYCLHLINQWESYVNNLNTLNLPSQRHISMYGNGISILIKILLYWEMCPTMTPSVDVLIVMIC